MIWFGLFVPLLGTMLGSALVYFQKEELPDLFKRALSGSAAGVMTAASVFSLLLPSIERSAHLGRLAFLPAVIGFLFGILFLLVLDRTIPHLHQICGETEGCKSELKRTTMMMLAVTLHNIPEGMAIGVVLAAGLDMRGAVFALALGLALQNIPEGALLSMPLRMEGLSTSRSFLYGTLSGVVEPIAAVLTLLAAEAAVSILPGLLGFAAGAMLYVVVEELIPDCSYGRHSNVGTLAFALGFALMMAGDVALG